MFEFFHYQQGKYVFVALIFLALCCYQSHYVNKQIDKVNNDNLLNPNRFPLESAPIVFPVIAIIFLIVALMSPLSFTQSDEYLSLQEKYDELLEKYEDLSSSVDDAYDDAICVKGYFLGWEEAPKQLAEKSMKELFDKLYPGEW